MAKMSKDLPYYRSLPYTRRVRLEEDKGGEYFVLSAFDDAISAMLEWGREIPEPDAWPGKDFVPAAPRAARSEPVSIEWEDARLTGASSVGASEQSYQLA